jgi:hypothetical protein
MRAAGLLTIRAGAPATLLVVDSAALRAGGRTSDSIVLTLPPSCGGKRLQTTASVGVSAS